MFLILPKGCQYGSDRCYCHCVLWCFEGLFLTDNNYYVIMADLIANVADVIATYWLMFTWLMLLPKCWLMLLPTIYGWCYCHVWLMLLPLLIVVILADVIANVMADVFTICGRWNSHFICDGLMLLPCARWYNHLVGMWADVVWPMWQMEWATESIILVLVLCCYWEPHPTYEAGGICLCSYSGMDHWLLCTWIL